MSKKSLLNKPDFLACSAGGRINDDDARRSIGEGGADAFEQLTKICPEQLHHFAIIAVETRTLLLNHFIGNLAQIPSGEEGTSLD